MLILLLSAGAPALQAQGYRVFVMGGGSGLFNKRYYNVYGVSFGSTYKTGAGFTAGAEIPLIRHLSVEGSYGYVLNNLAVTNFFNSAVPNDEVGYSIRDQRVSVDAIAHGTKTIKGVRPYLAAGIEFDRFAPTTSAAALAKSAGFNGVRGAVLSPDNKFGFNFGFGVDVHLIGMLALRIDARDHLTHSPTYGLPSSASSGFTAYYPIGGRAQDIELSAGFVVHFGK